MTLMEIYRDWYKNEDFTIFPQYNTDVDLTEIHAKIKRRFWLREIGCETPDRFLLYFEQTYLEWIGQYCILKKALDKDFQIYVNQYTTRDVTAETTTTADNVTDTINTGCSDTTNADTSVTEMNGNSTNEERRGLDGRGNLVDSENTPYTATSQNDNYSSGRTWEKGHNSNMSNNGQMGSNVSEQETKNVNSNKGTIENVANQEQNGKTQEIMKGLTNITEIEAFILFMEKYPNLDIWFMDKLDECFMQILY